MKEGVSNLLKVNRMFMGFRLAVLAAKPEKLTASSRFAMKIKSTDVEVEELSCDS